MAAPLYFGREEIAEIISWPLLIEAVEEALKAASEMKATDGNNPFVSQPPRTITHTGIDENIMLTMPGFVGNYQLNKNTNGTESASRCDTLACKIVTCFGTNKLLGNQLPSLLSNILLFNTNTGRLECIMEGTQITAWRTAAASIVATKFLYCRRFEEFAKRKLVVAIIGCGAQGESHAIGMCSTFNVSELYIWNRSVARAMQLSQILYTKFPEINVIVVNHAADAVSNADVICIATFSPDPLIDFTMIKKPIVHINAVGAGQVHFGEVSQCIYDNAEVYVDSWANAKVELKDLKADIVGELGEAMCRLSSPSKADITIFQSMGMAAEDATVAQALYNKLKTKHNLP